MDTMERAEGLCRELRLTVLFDKPEPEDLARWLRERIPDRAGQVLEGFRQSLPGIRESLRQDLQAALDADPAAADAEEVLEAYPGFRAVTAYRLAHCLWELEVPLLPRLITGYAHRVTGIDIHPGARIGPGFFIDHGTGVVIGETAEVGRNVTLYHGVTLGALSVGRELRGRKRHPTLEDAVTVYANATILGGDTVVGRGTTVGAHVLLTRSVPPNSRVNYGDANCRG